MIISKMINKFLKNFTSKKPLYSYADESLKMKKCFGSCTVEFGEKRKPKAIKFY